MKSITPSAIRRGRQPSGNETSSLVTSTFVGPLGRVAIPRTSSSAVPTPPFIMPSASRESLSESPGHALPASQREEREYHHRRDPPLHATPAPKVSPSSLREARFHPTVTSEASHRTNDQLSDPACEKEFC
jgi:hypothetical protein